MTDENTAMGEGSTDPKDYTNLTVEQLRQKQTEPRFEPSPTIISKEYAEKLKKKEFPSFAELLKKSERAMAMGQRKRATLPYSYEQLRVPYFRYLCKQLQGKPFRKDGNIVEVIERLLKYLIGDPSCGLDLYRGIYLWGNVGVGKTMIMDAIQEMLHDAEAHGLRFKSQSVKQLSFNLQGTKDTNILRRYFKDSYCFDDFGSEDPEQFIYSSRISVMDEILTARRERFKHHFELTHVTSNVPPEAISDRYMERFESRCKEMFNYIHLKGSDKRGE